MHLKLNSMCRCVLDDLSQSDGVGWMICRKVVRQVYYLLQVLLGVGSAGTPSPTPGKACIPTFVHLCIHPSACLSLFVSASNFRPSILWLCQV